MAEGTIKKLTDKGFGFIDTGNNQDMFFHMSNLELTRSSKRGNVLSTPKDMVRKGPELRT